MEAAGRSLSYYLIGHPVGHSLSPAIYNGYFRLAGIPGSYDVMDVPHRGLLPRAVELLRKTSGGFNVTIPYKTDIIGLLDRVEGEALEIGAVNTVVVEGARLRGYNTDLAGFMKALLANGGPEDYSRAFLIGAGGAARAVAYGLAGMVDHLVIVSRSGRSARRLAYKAREWGIPDAVGGRLDDLARYAEGSDLVVNASPVGLRDPGASPLPPRYVPSGATVMDLVYNPLRTRLLRVAEEKGCRVIDGLWMLVYQASENLRLWLGVNVDPRLLRSLALEAMG